ncbi:MAG: hypothetical protein WCP34_03355 [Pseudomonadota bacterium]
MTEPVHPSEERLQARIAIMEDLLRQVVDINAAAATRLHGLDEKLHKIEVILPALTSFIKRMDTPLSPPPDSPAFKNEIADIRNRLEEFHKEWLNIPQRLETLLEKVGTNPQGSPNVPMMDKWNELAGFPEMVGRLESQQSTILQTLEKRVDPRLMIYLKPLIEMLEEEGQQAEQLKNAALQRLQVLISGKSPGSDQEISQVLQQVDQEIRRCTEAFERTQQALQIVVTPFQNIGRLFRNNLEIVVQAHDLMAQLHDDLPRFLSDMKARHEEHLKA